MERTFKQFSSIDLARRELKRDNMSLCIIMLAVIQVLRGSPEFTCASLSSLMGMPIVEVSFPMVDYGSGGSECRQGNDGEQSFSSGQAVDRSNRCCYVYGCSW
jgi:hypothetical protein